MPNAIWLDVDADELAVLCDSGESLASVGTEHWCSWEFEVESADEVTGGISEESDARFLVGVKGLGPRVHADVTVRIVFLPDSGGEDLHEGVIDGDDKDFTGVLELCVGDVVWDVRVGAGWAYSSLVTRLN